MHYIYCPKCGSLLSSRKAGDDGLVPYCEDCKKFWFDTFASCVIVLVYNEYDEVVLCRQSYLSDKYATITSGYITPGETAEEAAVREVKEELGIDISNLEYGGTYWFGANDMLMYAFMGYTKKCEFTLSEEVDKALWIPAKEAEKYMFPDSPGNASVGVLKRFLSKRYGVMK